MKSRALPERHLDGLLRCLVEEHHELVGFGRVDGGEERRRRIVGVHERRRKGTPVGRVARNAELTGEIRAGPCDWLSILRSSGLAPHAIELIGERFGGLEAIVGRGCGCAHDDAVQRIGRRVLGHGGGRGQARLERALEPDEVGAQHRERPADRVEIGRDGRPRLRDLGRLETGGAPDRARFVVHSIDAAEVDQLHRLVGQHHVVGLEVAEQEPALVQVAQRREDLEHVFDCNGDGKRRGRAAVVGPAPDEHVLQARVARVLHDDVAVLPVLDEVVDLDDVRMLHLREEPAFGERGRHRVVVGSVEQALQHHPPIFDTPIEGEVDPTEPSVGDATDDCVLPADYIARRELGREREGVPALAAEPLSATRLVAAPPADRFAAIAPAAEPLLLGHGRIGQHDGRRIEHRHRRRRRDTAAGSVAGRRRT